MPREVAIKISSDVARVLKVPEMRDRFIAQGADPVGSTPDEFAAYMRAETAKWARLVKTSGARAD
jgi:tripartite-type tricarboxylate transporter receptor subunit TctC